MRSDVLGMLGKGLIAGAAGTAVMTLGQELERRVTRRPASTEPARAAEKFLHIEPRSEKGELELAHAVHWLYGTAWGAMRGLIARAGLGPVAGTFVHFAAVSGVAGALLPALKLEPPPDRSSKQQLLLGTLHHAVYAIGTGLAFQWLMRRASSG